MADHSSLTALCPAALYPAVYALMLGSSRVSAAAGAAREPAQTAAEARVRARGTGAEDVAEASVLARGTGVEAAAEASVLARGTGAVDVKSTSLPGEGAGPDDEAERCPTVTPYESPSCETMEGVLEWALEPVEALQWEG